MFVQKKKNTKRLSTRLNLHNKEVGSFIKHNTKGEDKFHSYLEIKSSETNVPFNVIEWMEINCVKFFKWPSCNKMLEI